jgi:Spy/CpxP family protein refolding chaperone
MNKLRIVIIALTLVTVVAGTAMAIGPGTGTGTGPRADAGLCPLTSDQAAQQTQQYAKLQKDILPLKQRMLALRTELMELYAQAKPDWNAISAKKKEIVDVQTEIQKSSTSAGFGGYGCGMGYGRGMGHGHGRGMGYGGGMGYGRGMGYGGGMGIGNPANCPLANPQ